MTHKELILLAEKQLKSWRCYPILTELYTCNGTGEIPDAIGWTCRDSILFEIKASRSDFLRDHTKLFRFDLPDLGMGDWRFYVTNPGVVRSVDELPKGWGVYEVSEDEKKLRHQLGVKYGAWENAPLVGHKHNEITMLRSCIRRMSK